MVTTPGLADDVVLAAGAPVVCVPAAGSFETVGGKVLVAWNGSRESARALHDALPILRHARHVIVASVNDVPEGRAGLEEACALLAAHGITAETRRIPAGEVDVGDALLDAAADFGVDLLVMGCYGHSRAREFVWGGATRSLLRHMTVPVLFSH
jgi:nucleotide-binding universal stress UspA family protein